MQAREIDTDRPDGRVTALGPARSSSRIVLVTLGTRGDIQPFCVLGRALTRAGFSVTVVANADYRSLIESFGLAFTDPGGGGLGPALFSTDKAAAFDQHAKGLRHLAAGLRLIGPAQDHLAELMTGCVTAIRSADLVIFNAMAFFAGEFARELAIPAIRITAQPLLPSWRISLVLFGGRDVGRLVNRASYEAFRGLTALAMRRALKIVRRRTGLGARLRAGVNPLTIGLSGSRQLLAFSAILASDPGDWPKPYCQTGFLVAPPEPGAVLPEAVERFLSSGPPPVYVGFGSMRMNGRRNATLVLDALARSGQRALLARGAGGLDLPETLPDGIMAIGAIDHDLLLPRVSAVVHHGGSGTVAAALRHGRPSVILPVLGDQLFWGRRVAALGAAEPPLALGRIDPAELAARIGRAAQNGPLRAAATRAAERLAGEPGLAGAVNFVVGTLSATQRGAGA